MRAGWGIFFVILVLVALMTAFLSGYSLHRGSQVTIVEDDETIKIYGIYEYPIIYEKEQYEQDID